MIGIHGIISWKETFAVKRMIFHIQLLDEIIERNKKTRNLKDEEEYLVNQATQSARIATSWLLLFCLKYTQECWGLEGNWILIQILIISLGMLTHRGKIVGWYHYWIRSKTEGFLWPVEDESLFCDIVTSQVFSDDIYKNLIGAYNTGRRLYQEHWKLGSLYN